MSFKQKLFLAGIVLLAVFYRFYLIKALPGGLFPDEAANGLDINLMQQGQLQPFYERGNGREALFFYMLWGSVEIFGKGAWQHHIVSALIGVLAVIICFLVAKELFQLFAKNEEDKKWAIPTALLSAFFIATSSWHIVLSRTAFRANLIPLFAGLVFYLMLLTFKAKTTGQRYFWSAMTGAAFSLGFYSYIAYRILVPVIIILVLWPLAVDLLKSPRFQNLKKFFKPALVALLAAVIFIAPLAHYFYTHPGSFIGRSGQVSVFNPDLNGGDLVGTILEVTRLSVLAYFTDGDLNWRHNVSGEPFLSIIISPFFLIGMVITLLLAIRYAVLPHKYPHNWKHFLLAGWFWSMLVPVVTTAEGIPHGLRSIGTIPAVFIITAIGVVGVVKGFIKLYQKYQDRISSLERQTLKTARLLLVVTFFGAIISQSYILYFIQTANSPENYYAFRSDLSVVSEYLKANGSKDNTYLILDKFSVQTPDYITVVDGKNPENPKNQPYKQVDPENSWELTGLNKGDKIVFTQSSIFDIKKFKSYHPEASLIKQTKNQFNQTIMAVYEIQ